MATLELYKQDYQTIRHIEQFLLMCKNYGIKKMCDQVDDWMIMIDEEGTPVPVDEYLMSDANDYLFAHGRPADQADLSVRIRDVKILLKTRRIRDHINLIQVKIPFQYVFRTPFKREWDKQWKSILVDADNVQICKFDLPHQQKCNKEYDVGTAVAEFLNFRTRKNKYVGIDMPTLITPTFDKDRLDIYYSIK